MRTLPIDRYNPTNYPTLGDVNTINMKCFKIIFNEQFKTSIKTTKIKI